MALKMALILMKSTWNYLKEFYSVLQQSITLDNVSDISTIKNIDDDIMVQQEIYYIKKEAKASLWYLHHLEDFIPLFYDFMSVY